MEVSPNALRKATVETLRQVEEQIKEVRREAWVRDVGGILPAETEEEAGDRMACEFRDDSGTWPMIPLLLAKAQCLNTLTLLNEQGKKSSAWPRSG